MRRAQSFARVQHHACRLAAGVVLLAACRQAPSPSVGDDAAIVATLGARDGYLIVVNPFNCLLRDAQIRVINELASRSRRGGRLLMAGTEPADSAEAARALRALGIMLPASPLSASPLARTATLQSLGWPLVLAVRDGRVIGALAGGETARVGTWIKWLEHSAVLSAVTPS